LQYKYLGINLTKDVEENIKLIKDIKENLNISSSQIRRHYKIKISILPHIDS